MGARRTAHVTWNGGLEDGSGTITGVTSAAFGSLPVSWPSRIEEPEGKTSPEELIAAAHAACYCMQLSHGLSEAGMPPKELKASATVTFALDTGITISALTVEGRVPGCDPQTFQALADAAKDGCPVSGALRGNVDLTVEARLVD